MPENEKDLETKIAQVRLLAEDKANDEMTTECLEALLAELLARARANDNEPKP